MKSKADLYMQVQGSFRMCMLQCFCKKKKRKKERKCNQKSVLMTSLLLFFVRKIIKMCLYSSSECSRLIAFLKNNKVVLVCVSISPAIMNPLIYL